jgi:hypothetical protein
MCIASRLPDHPDFPPPHHHLRTPTEATAAHTRLWLRRLVLCLQEHWMISWPPLAMPLPIWAWVTT